MQSQTSAPTIEITLENEQQSPTSTSFNEAFLEAVDAAFSLLGEPGAQAVFRYLESRCGISRIEIPEDVERFAESVEILFGQAADLIEIQIVRVLHQKFPSFDFRSQNGKLSFAEYVGALRSFCM